MKRENDAKGPIIKLVNYGAYEGWRVISFDNLQEAIDDPVYGNEYAMASPMKLTAFVDGIEVK